MQNPTTPHTFDNFEIAPNHHWAIIGGNGSGKSSFARCLKNQYSERASLVSFEDEQALLEREIYEDDSEWLNKIDHGRTTRELISELSPSHDVPASLIDTLQLASFIDTGFRLLSTGERRRLMLARALVQSPDILILDEPFDGLDHAFSQHLDSLLTQIAHDTQIILVTNRLSEMGDYITHIACLHQSKIILSGIQSQIQNSLEFQQLYTPSTLHKTLPPPPSNHTPYQADPATPIADLRSIRVAYHNKVILDQLNWTIHPKQHWKVSGPNGCGKSTLVNLISGDHPQCYSNEIYLFGKKRGIGESIWDIKQHMGLMSTTLHQQHRITITAETVILSGFFDTIGVYRPTTSEHRSITLEWLDYLGLTEHKNTNFHQLSFGQQRILLIARALVKRPHLLILDEPCQGLDPMNRALVINLIEKLVAHNAAQLIYISHEPEDRIDCLTHELNFIPTTNPTPESSPYTIQTTALT
ncbi:molybdate ABC transporter ATP-binding protein ModF [Rubritalea tangerina]|uniref:Molybdate ABC transporter ATP-binding protein ModF n=2 Tax=Rubritalea tangerina TaxID=430798 RepID=A0ABW4Z7K0_9BACT